MMIRRIVTVLIVCVSLAASAGCERNLNASTKIDVKPKPPSHSQPANELLQRSGGLFDAARVGSKTLVAVGKLGEILRSEDNGKRWHKIASPTSQPLLSVAFSDSQHGVIVGAGGTYLESADSGKSWTQRSIGVHDNLFEVRFFGHGAGFIVGAFGTLLRSEDNGKSWDTVSVKWEQLLPQLSQELGLVQPHLYGVTFCDPQHGWVVGEYGLILGTQDGGKTWQRQMGGGMSDLQLFTVTSVGPGEAVASGQGGKIVYTADYGSHWVTSLPPSGLDLYTLVRLDSKTQTLVALGDLGSAYISTDGGRPESWRRLNLAHGAAAALADSWLAAAVPNNDDLLAFGQLGVWRLAFTSTANSPS